MNWLLKIVLVGVGFLALGVIFCPHPAGAHKLLIDYTLTKDGAFIEAFFPDGRPASRVPLRLLDAQEQVLVEALTDKNGGHLFAIREVADYVADADAGLGHYAKIEIPAVEIATVIEGQADPASGAVVPSKKEPGVSDAVQPSKTSKVKREELPVGRIVIGIAVIFGLGFISWWFSKRRRQTR